MNSKTQSKISCSDLRVQAKTRPQWPSVLSFRTHISQAYKHYIYGSEFVAGEFDSNLSVFLPKSGVLTRHSGFFSESGVKQLSIVKIQYLKYTSMVLLSMVWLGIFFLQHLKYCWIFCRPFYPTANSKSSCVF